MNKSERSIRTANTDPKKAYLSTGNEPNSLTETTIISSKVIIAPREHL